MVDHININYNTCSPLPGHRDGDPWACEAPISLCEALGQLLGAPGVAGARLDAGRASGLRCAQHVRSNRGRRWEMKIPMDLQAGDRDTS